MNAVSKVDKIFKIIVILVTLSILLTTTQQAETQTECHYSCLTCTQNYFDKCLQCKQKYTYYETVRTQRTQPNKWELIRYGLCSGTILMEFNPLGIIALIAFIIIFWIKNKNKKNQSTFMILCWLQSLSMLSFIPIPFIEPLSFLVQSFTSFMPITMLQKSYKMKQKSESLLENHYYRLQNFLHTVQVDRNMYILAPLITVLTLYIILIPLFMCIRKALKKEGCMRKCSQNILKKVQSFFYISYFFLIQEAYIILFVALKYSQFTTKTIIFTVIFVLTNIFMIINFFIKPIPYFPNRKVQFVAIIERILMPLMFFLKAEAFFIAIPILLIVARISDCPLNNKQYNLMPTQKNKYFGFLIQVILIVICISILIMVENVGKNQIGVKVISYITSALIFILYGSTFGFQIFQVVYDWYKGQIEQQKMRNILIRQQSTNMHFNTDATDQTLKNNIEIELQIDEGFLNQQNDRPQSENKIKKKILNFDRQFQKHQSSKKLHSNKQFVKQNKSTVNQSMVREFKEQANIQTQQIKICYQNKDKNRETAIADQNSQIQVKKIDSLTQQKQDNFQVKFESIPQIKQDIFELNNQNIKQRVNEEINIESEQIKSESIKREQIKPSMKKHKSKNKKSNNRGLLQQKSIPLMQQKQIPLMQQKQIPQQKIGKLRQSLRLQDNMSMINNKSENQNLGQIIKMQLQQGQFKGLSDIQQNRFNQNENKLNTLEDFIDMDTIIPIPKQQK